MRKLLPVIAVLSLLSACGKDSQASAKATAEDMKAKAAKGIADTKEAVNKAIADFQKSAEPALSKVDDQIAQLKAKASSASDSAKAEMDEALSKIEVERKKFADQMVELKTATPEKAKELLAKLESGLASLKKSAEDAVARFK